MSDSIMILNIKRVAYSTLVLNEANILHKFLVKRNNLLVIFTSYLPPNYLNVIKIFWFSTRVKFVKVNDVTYTHYKVQT